ncbi:MAG TPA: hypothetical protein ENI72_04220, partial [Rhodospirillales bacterium]|nr:hypothetical protein [Rhodospirillales bacterium]
MSLEFSAKKICEKALRKIGAFSINDSAADGDELNEALEALDLLVAEQAGSTTCFWLIPATVSIPLTGGTATYDLISVLGASAPTDGIQFPVYATLKTDGGNETPLSIVTRDEYEGISKKTAGGSPDRIWIDRLKKPT